ESLSPQVGGAALGPPGETPVAVKRDARMGRFSLIWDRGFEFLKGRVQRTNFRGAAHSWQGTQHRSLSAVARKITGSVWSGPLFSGLNPGRSTPGRLQAAPQASEPMEDSDAAS